MRVNILYRPLRIGWAIRAGDFEAFRRAARYSFALWGGRYNPIVIIDREREAKELIELFRVDVIVPLDDNEQTKAFAARFPHLISPFHGQPIFLKGTQNDQPHSYALDVSNALAHFGTTPTWTQITQFGVNIYNWSADDPLADVLLAQLGGYPAVEDVGTDYQSQLLATSEGNVTWLARDSALPPATFESIGISSVSRLGMERHHNGGWPGLPGFYVGRATDLDDLVAYWNLRACDIQLAFVDPEHIARYTGVVLSWEKAMRDMVGARRHEWDRRLAIWTRGDFEQARAVFPGSELAVNPVSDGIWNGLNVQPPTMSFGESSSLGIMSSDGGKPRASFEFSGKPFSTDSWFNRQFLVAAVSFIGGLHRDEQHTFRAPYLPELNEFYSRTMHFDYSKLRAEPERIGIVISVADKDALLHALPVSDLIERVVQMAGYNSAVSSAGLIVRQLLATLGGVQGARAFKIPGVRRLIRTYGPRETFAKRGALQLIGSKDPDFPDALFSDHEDLYIERRATGTKLEPEAVLGYLVEKGLFRIGAELTCPQCRLKLWVSLDVLKHRVSCELCGHDFDATRQLTDTNEWRFRRSGVLGVERNAQGAVPVALTLQQLATNLESGFRSALYSPSLELTSTGAGATCEVDFVWLTPGRSPAMTAVLLGECKDLGPITGEEVAKLKAVADAFPTSRFETFVVLAQVAPFSADQIEAAKTLNDKYRHRAILLSARELEPYHVYERSEEKLGRVYAISPEDMAQATSKLYFA